MLPMMHIDTSLCCSFIFVEATYIVLIRIYYDYTVAFRISLIDIFFGYEWQEKLNSDVAMRGINAGGNKLRIYQKFKHSYSTEPYVKTICSKKYRSAYAKFRCGVAPLKIETCRYGLNRIPVAERLCESCQVVEDEFNVMMVCPLFNDIRSQFILQLNEVELSFYDYTQAEQLIYVMSNTACYKIISKAMYFILNKKHQMFYR